MDHTHDHQPDSAGDEQDQRAAETGNVASDPAGDPLAQAEEKAEQYLRNWQRAAADLQNFRRRTEEERAEQARLHKATLLINVLPVFDDLDRAVAAVDANLAGLSWVQGITAIHRKFTSLLESMDVKPIAAENAPFDPALHEAIGQQPGPEGVIVAVLQKGYTLGDRVIRPTMVIVGNGEEATDSTQQ